LNDEERERALRLIYLMILFVLPLFIMSFFRDRKPRYLYPFAFVGGILAAEALRRAPRWLIACTWLAIAAMAVGIPVAGVHGVFNQVRVDGMPWYSAKFGYGVAAIVVLLLGVFIALSPRRPRVFVIGGSITLLVAFNVYVLGARHSLSGNGASEMLPLAKMLWEKYPTVDLFDIAGEKQTPADLAIYLNRPIHPRRKLEFMPAGPLPQLFVGLQREKGPEHETPPGWRFFAKVPRDRDWWVAYVRE
jgi:hypothetical protein